jgi:hypothetical protein
MTQINPSAQVRKALHPKWGKYRLKQIDTLQTLLYEVAAINNGSNAIGRIQKCIRMARELDKRDLRHKKICFMQFLISEAWGNGEP